MKNIIFILSIILLSCGDNEPVKTSTNVDVDSLLEKTKQTFESAKIANQNGDSSISGKVDKTVQKIQVMENQITELKEENNELKDKLNDANDAGERFDLLPVSDDKNY